MFFTEWLDNRIHYQDPSLPQLSQLSYLYLAILVLSSLIALDIRQKKRGKKVSMAEEGKFSSVSVMGTWREALAYMDI